MTFQTILIIQEGENMALHVMEEANRCLGCKKPRCREGCPIHTNTGRIEVYIHRAKYLIIDKAGLIAPACIPSPLLL